MTKKQKALKQYFIKKGKIKKGEKVSVKKLDKLFDKLNDKESYKANEYILLQTEQKKYDYIYCSDIGRLSKKDSIFKYKNLLEWDKKWWKFQKKHLGNTPTDSKWYQINFASYNDLYLQGEWFRWMEQEEYQKKPHMVYGHLEGLRSYVSIKISEKIEDEIEKLYPHNYYREYKEPMFKKAKKSKLYTMNEMKIRAGGKEEELEKLKKSNRENFPYIEEIVLEKIKPYSGYTFTKWYFPDYKPKEKIYDGMKFMIIGGKKAAKNISFKSFLKDFHELSQPFGLVDNLIEEIWDIVKKDFFNQWVKESKKNYK